MDTKLTLKLNQESILLAKNYAAEKEISLSKLVENFFDSISLESAEMSATPQYAALIQELSGIISLPGDFDEKEDAIQWYTAQQHQIKILLTRNIGDYKTAGITVQTPEMFLIASGLL